MNFEEINETIKKTNTNELLKNLSNYFEFSNDTYRTAYLNWRFEPREQVECQFFNLAEGYFDTAIHLIQECIKSNFDRKADIWIFPILFNVVHGIEIYLKGFNSLYPIYKNFIKTGQKDESKIFGKHDIKQLCETALAKIKETGDKEFYNEMLFIKRFIEILYANTNDMAFARYPLTKNKKDKQFYVSYKNVTVDLQSLYLWVVKISDILSNICLYIFDNLSELEEYYEEEKLLYENFYEW